MGNIYTYIKWRGDLSFQEREFCDADNLVLSQFVYADLSGFVPTREEGGYISLEEAFDKIKQSCRKDFFEEKNINYIVNLMAATKRYSKLKLFNYTDILDEETGTQFAAMHIGIDDKTVYVAFRGTDDNLLGWREDFSMSFQLMPSQKLATDYLKNTICEDKNYIVGGHSKGGNLAVYASMNLNENQLGSIIEIYNNDGPGISEDIVDIKNYNQISLKLKRIVPQFSIIGSLFEREKPTEIVLSSAEGFMQHDILSWQIEGDHLLLTDTLSKSCQFCNEIFDNWIESGTPEQKKSFTNDFFQRIRSRRCHNGPRSFKKRYK